MLLSISVVVKTHWCYRKKKETVHGFIRLKMRVLLPQQPLWDWSFSSTPKMEVSTHQNTWNFKMDFQRQGLILPLVYSPKGFRTKMKLLKLCSPSKFKELRSTQDSGLLSVWEWHMLVQIEKIYLKFCYRL